MRRWARTTSSNSSAHGPAMHGGTGHVCLRSLSPKSTVQSPQSQPDIGHWALDMKLKVDIFGGSGYGGSELLRILLQHPQVEIAFVTANEHAGKPVGDVHRNLAGLTDLSFIKAPDN